MTYQLYLTALGATKIATAATAGGKAIHITEFAVGQGVDVDFTQRLDKQTLVSKRYQGAVSAVSQVVNQPNQYEVACIVPQDVGGWFIREVGLIDSDGDLIWVGNLPEVQKPDGSSLAAVDYRINCMVSIDNYSGAVTLVVDGNVITATRKWVDLNFANKKEMDAWLQSINDELTAIRNRPFEGIPVHGILATTKHYQSGDEVTADLRYGKWARYAQGKILAGYSLLASDIPEYKTMGNEFGENSHTLTVAEMPKHNHGSNMRFEAGEAILVDAELATKVDSGDMLDHMNEDTTASTNTTYSGNNQPHNNLQPAVVVAFWVRMPDNYIAPKYEMFWTTDSDGNNRIASTGEGQALYLWLTAQDLVQSMVIGLSIEANPVITYGNGANFKYPTAIGNGKHLITALTPDSYSVTQSTTLNVGATLADGSQLNAPLVINDTVANTPIVTLETIQYTEYNLAWGDSKIINPMDYVTSKGSSTIQVVAIDDVAVNHTGSQSSTTFGENALVKKITLAETTWGANPENSILITTKPASQEIREWYRRRWTDKGGFDYGSDYSTLPQYIIIGIFYKDTATGQEAMTTIRFPMPFPVVIN